MKTIATVDQINNRLGELLIKEIIDGLTIDELNEAVILGEWLDELERVERLA